MSQSHLTLSVNVVGTDYSLDSQLLGKLQCLFLSTWMGYLIHEGFIGSVSIEGKEMGLVSMLDFRLSSSWPWTY